MGGHRNETLQREWKEFGEPSFKFEILAEIAQKDDATLDYSKEVKELEKLYIEELQPFAEKGCHTTKCLSSTPLQ